MKSEYSTRVQSEVYKKTEADVKKILSRLGSEKIDLKTFTPTQFRKFLTYYWKGDKEKR